MRLRADKAHPRKIALAYLDYPFKTGTENKLGINHDLRVDANRIFLELAVGLGVAGRQAAGCEQGGKPQAFRRDDDLAERQLAGITLTTDHGVPACNGAFGSGGIMESRGQFTRKSQLEIARIELAAGNV